MRLTEVESGDDDSGESESDEEDEQTNEDYRGEKVNAEEIASNPSTSNESENLQIDKKGSKSEIVIKEKTSRKHPVKSVVQEQVSKATDEYDAFDTSDEEDIRNTVGNIPKNW